MILKSPVSVSSDNQAKATDPRKKPFLLKTRLRAGGVTFDFYTVGEYTLK
ncbi:MAG TPA: hypothetical protein PLA94_06185 [Myxococcota bacterium]|nr:hypothetical protein [Myxococcota bacterium]